MKKIVLSIMLCAVLAYLPGCSIYKAATAPPPVALDGVKVGANRINIVGALGVPKSTETKAESKTDVYEFVDGSANVSKLRIVLYIAGDLYTLGLAELIFWPVELGFGQGTEGRAVVTYGMDDIARAVLLNKRDGTPWEVAKTEEVQPVALEKATNSVNPETGAIIQ
jgi:hypothetical protein